MDKQITLASNLEIHWVLVVRCWMLDVFQVHVFGTLRGPQEKSALIPHGSWFSFLA